MADNILYLHPRDPHIEVDTRALTEALHDIGLIAEPFLFQGTEHFKPGEEFLHLLTFLGCSPVVSLGEPGLTGDEFCHIEFTTVTAEPRFISGDNIKVPRCRHCNHRIDDWTTLLDTWRSDGTDQWYCPSCGKVTPLHRLKWKQCAGFGRQFIKVWGIFEGEAVPGEELMNALRTATHQEWDYFYVRSHD